MVLATSLRGLLENCLHETTSTNDNTAIKAGNIRFIRLL